MSIKHRWYLLGQYQQVKSTKIKATRNMPSFCAVVGCAKRAERDKVRFFRIPAALKNRGEKLDAISLERRQCWIRSLKRGNLSEPFLKNARICSDHFITGQPADLEDKNNPDWTPSQNMGYVSLQIKNPQAAERHSRSIKRGKRQGKRLKTNDMDTPKPDPEMMECEALHSGQVEEEQVRDKDRKSVEVQTDIDMDYLSKLLKDVEFCNEKIEMQNHRLKSLDLSKESFINNDKKTLYFTGFQKTDMMLKIFDCVASSLSLKSVLPPFQQFLLTLMRLRLNLDFTYLSYRFGVSLPTVSDIFYRCIDIFYEKFKTLVIWPSREMLQKNMPACFKTNFGNRVAVIIDCFEIFTEKPSGLINAARCWSNYKHHETIKFLVGITPQGTISYISETWGGRTSDKFLTENCGFLDKILPGDLILADRGFLIQDSVEIIGGQLGIPAFTKGKTQLHPTDLESTRNIANVRIHVERIIGLLKKKYHILQGRIPISMLSASREKQSVLDKILIVCSAFINLCPSQIPMD